MKGLNCVFILQRESNFQSLPPPQPPSQASVEAQQIYTCSYYNGYLSLNWNLIKLIFIAVSFSFPVVSYYFNTQNVYCGWPLMREDTCLRSPTGSACNWASYSTPDFIHVMVAWQNTTEYKPILINNKNQVAPLNTTIGAQGNLISKTIS